jgi:hypothetical protein
LGLGFRPYAHSERESERARERKAYLNEYYQQNKDKIKTKFKNVKNLKRIKLDYYVRSKIN